MIVDFINSDFARWLNVVASSLVVILLTMGTIARWEYMPARFRRILPWVIATYVIIAYGSAEVAWSEGPAPEGYRVVLMLLTLFGLIIALLYGINDEGYDEKDGTSDTPAG